MAGPSNGFTPFSAMHTPMLNGPMNGSLLPTPLPPPPFDSSAHLILSRFYTTSILVGGVLGLNGSGGMVSPFSSFQSQAQPFGGNSFPS